MTTTQDRPTFTADARGNYPCPHPDCRQTFTRTQGVSRHYNQQHADHADVIEPEPEEEDDDETFSPEVEALHAQIFGSDSDEDEDVEDDEHVCDTGNFDRTSCADPCGEMHSYCSTCGIRQDSCAHDVASPATANGVQLLPPAVFVDADAILALSDATCGLVDAITRLVAIGYGRQQAHDIVLDLIDRLHDQPTPAAPAA